MVPISCVILPLRQNHDISFPIPPKQLHGLSEWHPERYLLTKSYRSNAAAKITQRPIRSGTLPRCGKKKWFESVHVSLTLIQGRIKDFYCGRRRMWGGKRGHQKLRKLGVQKGVEEIMSRRIQQGPLFMQVVLATSFVTEPKRAFFLLCDQYINTAKQCQTVHQFFPIEWSELIKAILY